MSTETEPRLSDVSAVMRYVPLVGYPIGQVLTPPMFNAHFERSGVNALMLPVEMRSEEVGNFFAALRGWTNCMGCSITIPHKQAAFAAADQLTDRAQRAGAVNFLRREMDGSLIGDMTDGLAMVAAIKQHGASLDGASVVLAGGAGGAGGAIADALCEAGVAALTLLDPRQDLCAQMAERLRGHHQGTMVDVVAGDCVYDFAINASPMGMKAGDPLPIDLDRVSRQGVVADVVTKPILTPLLQAAQARDLRTVSGDRMAAAQLPFQFRHLGLEMEGAA